MMKKTAIKILQTVIIPYVLLVILLYISFWVSQMIAQQVILSFFKALGGSSVHPPILATIVTISLTLILGIGAIKFIDRYNQEKEQP